ncbi:MAG: hypothetical protein HY815_24875 [Candidatus Riflebacteria bacterium]|nr:hypothetical protein [Candidatus Riflebacteria bacterium]
MASPKKLSTKRRRPAPGPVPEDPARPPGELEIAPAILSRRICDFDLRIEGGPLERPVHRFLKELDERRIVKLKPVFYLSDDWGVPDGTVAIGIPFYLADRRLLDVQRARGGMIEGVDEEDILRYLRHELGHVVNYAYRLHERDDWIGRFGPMSRPYVDEYRSVPFDPDFVRHLPGNYAQKHPDDDWAETFAVWMTPGLDWRALYADAPIARAKLEYCAAVMEEVRDREPDVVSTELDEDASQIRKTVQEFYDDVELGGVRLPVSLDGDLRGIFAPCAGNDHDRSPARQASAAALIHRNEDELATTVYRWTGVDPDVTYAILGYLERRSRALGLAYPPGRRDAVLMQLTAFLTTLAMNHVYRGSFVGK